MTTTIAGGCVNPICLRGYYQRIAGDTGEVLALFGSPERPAGILRVACKDRRASRCPTCARLYQHDAYQLLAAGLRGGKTVPAAIREHPAVMLTLTAPSFGTVHRNHEPNRRCRCGRRHNLNDPLLGTPLDHDRYRYTDQVIWNHLAPELWKRTVQAIRRGLAEALGTHRSKLGRVAQVRFAKVAEFQRRGAVHYHAILRVDGSEGPDAQPPAECTTELLEQIVNHAARTAAVPRPDALTELGSLAFQSLRWGAQREFVVLDRQTCTMAASYIAKYATKATETVTCGKPIMPIRSAEQLGKLELAPHARALISAAWAVGERTGFEGFKRWAHQFGYGGHTLTKSRQYSVTFAALRDARAKWYRTTNGEGEILVRAQLTYAGRGREGSTTVTVPIVGSPAGLMGHSGRRER